MKMGVWLKQRVDNTKGICTNGAQWANEKHGTRVIAAQYQSGQQHWNISAAIRVNVQNYVMALATAVGMQRRSAVKLDLRSGFIAEPCVIPT